MGNSLFGAQFRKAVVLKEADGVMYGQFAGEWLAFVPILELNYG